MNADALDSRRLRLIDQILRLPEDRLSAVEQLLLPPSPTAVFQQRSWPHAPLHRLCEQGTFIVTAATYQKEHLFKGPERLDVLEAELLTQARDAGWQLEAWAVFSNHYHFIGHALPGCQQLSEWLARLHYQTASQLNLLDGQHGRRVWFNYWETALTFEKSYLARLNYVHQNPVKHGLVKVANHYRWCSAPWFERTATPAQVQTIYSFKTDQIKVRDDFEPL